MQSSVWAVLSELFTQLLAALFGVTAEPPPITFEFPAADEAEHGGACAAGEFGLSRKEGARDVACLAVGGFVSVMATDGSGAVHVSHTGLLFQRSKRSPAVSDVNGDGQLDLVVLADTPEGVSDPTDSSCQFAVLLGDGAGGFSLGPSQRLPHECRALGAADFDEDGVPDFVVPHEDIESPTALSATLLLSRPGGEFEIRQFRSQPGSQTVEGELLELQQIAGDPVIVDADQNQHADIVFVTSKVAEGWSVPRSGALHVLLGDGQGGFRAGISRPLDMWGSTFSITAADYDEDGRTDVVVAVIRPYSISGPVELPRMLLGLGDGGFGEPIAIPPTEASADLHSADYDADGHVDLITSSVEGPVHFYAGRGDGSFAAPIGFALGSAPFWISTIDYGLDGTLDLVAATTKGLERLPLPLRQGSLGGPRVYSFILQSFLQKSGLSTQVIDFDGDSDNDIVGATNIGLIAFSNEGAEGFRVRDIELFARDDYPQALFFAMGDLNGDGRVDVVHSKPPHLRVHLQRTDESWEPLPPIARVNREQGAVRLELADANGDGRLDIVESESPHPYTSLAIHVQQADGQFSLLPTVTFAGDVVQFRDVDADGCFDVLVHVSYHVGVMVGDCSGNFALEHFAAVPSFPYSFEFADMNLDGRNDFVVQTGILLANASGGYDRTATFPVAYRVSVLELNGDGLPDVGLTGGAILTLAGDGNGSVADSQYVISYVSHYADPRLGDLVGDELPDAVVTNIYGPITHDYEPYYQGPPGHLVELTVFENISAR